jgi:hypothetical protein
MFLSSLESLSVKILKALKNEIKSLQNFAIVLIALEEDARIVSILLVVTVAARIHQNSSFLVL